MCPFSSFSFAMTCARATKGFGATPPYIPECKSVLAPRASTSVYTSPRRPTHNVGRSGAYISVSETRAKSAFNFSGFSRTYFAIDSPPTSSSPSTSRRILMGSLPAPLFINDSSAFRCMNICPLSSTAPRAYRFWLRSVGSNGGVVHSFRGSGGCTS